MGVRGCHTYPSQVRSYERWDGVTLGKSRRGQSHERSSDPTHIKVLDTGGFVATSTDVPGLVAEGRSIAAFTEIARGLARKLSESCIEHGDPPPPALTDLVDSVNEH